MTIHRTLAFLALFGVASSVPRAHATTLGALPPPAPSTTSGQIVAPDESAPVVPASADTRSVFASAPSPIGDASWSLRPFTLSGETAQPEVTEVVSDSPAPTPEPAGLFLLGTGAFATALSIRYRLFSL